MADPSPNTNSDYALDFSNSSMDDFDDEDETEDPIGRGQKKYAAGPMFRHPIPKQKKGKTICAVTPPSDRLPHMTPGANKIQWK